MSMTSAHRVGTLTLYHTNAKTLMTKFIVLTSGTRDFAIIVSVFKEGFDDFVFSHSEVEIRCSFSYGVSMIYEIEISM